MLIALGAVAIALIAGPLLVLRVIGAADQLNCILSEDLDFEDEET